MSKRQCSVKGCDKPYEAKGYCRPHYKRWRRWGDPLVVKRVKYANPEESFEARTMPVTETGCLLWTGASCADGYGYISVGGSVIRTHRYAWEREYGPVPEGMHIDHKCHTRACCNASHLRLATNAENSRNRSGPASSNTSGYRGVYWSKKAGKWMARIVLDGKIRHVGYFTDIEEAADAASAARKESYGEFAGRG